MKGGRWFSVLVLLVIIGSTLVYDDGGGYAKPVPYIEQEYGDTSRY